MKKLKTIIKMTTFGYKLGYNYPPSKKIKKTWLQLMATTLTKKINDYNFENLTIILHFLFLTHISNFALVICYLIFDL